MTEVNRERAHTSWRRAEQVKRLSDQLLKLGPFGVGVDGVLAWIPGANVVYSVGAGGFLLYEAVQCGASKTTLAKMAIYLLADSATSQAPIIGWAVDTLFRGHLMAAKVLQKDIEARHGRAEPAPKSKWKWTPGDDARRVRGEATFR